MPWSDKSFLIEIKPHTEYGSLYVAADEDDERDIVRIIHNGVDLCSLNDLKPTPTSTPLTGEPQTGDDVTDGILKTLVAVDINGEECDLDSIAVSKPAEPSSEAATPRDDAAAENHTLRAIVDGFLIDPTSVKNYAWTEDDKAFACKVKISLCDENEEPRNWNDALKYSKIKNFGLESYCVRLNMCNVKLKCKKCSQVFHREEELKSLKYYKLPSVEFNEIVDELFCHRHEHEKNSMYNYFVNGPKIDQCYVGSLYLLLNPDIADGCELSGTKKNLLVCKTCRAHVGCLDVSPAREFFPRKTVYRFYHVATNLYGRTKEEPESAPLFDIRYENMLQYFSWLFLTECEINATLYFVVRTLDAHPKVLVWILDSYLVMSLGKLIDYRLIDEVAKCKPYPVIKMLYKQLSDDDLNDSFVNGEHTGVANLYLPQGACENLTEYLLASCEELPHACRSLGKFKVGFLPISSEI